MSAHSVVDHSLGRVMKVVMTRAELDGYIHSYQRDKDWDDALIRPDKKVPCGWSVYVRMNHWDMYIPIEVNG